MKDIIPDKELTLVPSNDLPQGEIIGTNEEGKEILAYVIGSGPKKVSLLAGSHADEPVGPATIHLLIENAPKLSKYFEQFTFYCIPQINPDGEAKNLKWMKQWPNPSAYIKHVIRELPGKDIEFGYPNLRSENRAAVQFWKKHAPFDLHVNLHGMGFAEGVMLLIDRYWAPRTQQLRDGFSRCVKDLGLDFHVHNRKGEKGFFYIEDGFSTTPESEAMKTHFMTIKEDHMAKLFQQNSMEYIRSLGGDPLCLVTEIPLFTINHSEAGTLIPENYFKLKKMLPNLKSQLEKGESIKTELSQFGVRPVNIADAIRLQLETIELGLKMIMSHTLSKD